MTPQIASPLTALAFPSSHSPMTLTHPQTRSEDTEQRSIDKEKVRPNAGQTDGQMTGICKIAARFYAREEGRERVRVDLFLKLWLASASASATGGARARDWPPLHFLGGASLSL
ncbi:hypothetical protein BU24DRAFT_269512 [Aaosphaeria arxii CBS 175.79]|uniref:Uncharacterized protein n=1 Tax=Aaosphaeria arxii CBS 175.79 TaxID=1450172 RepID=A0A6A5XGU6_9PLEO|nr:uncharacterized protein BU24DRAFT_269512 [Aaosphaeria arxii CBS 175.79]KAF2012086.1 hypothetical protein BU24DRAFT_269512 [Aaosphaeria arxii CBS 175.79]